MSVVCRLTWLCAGVSLVEAAGLRLAVMTTLVRLLEVKLAELEGEGGTGSLEDDVQLLEGPLSGPGNSSINDYSVSCIYCKHYLLSLVQLHPIMLTSWKLASGTDWSRATICGVFSGLFLGL